MWWTLLHNVRLFVYRRTFADQKLRTFHASTGMRSTASGYIIGIDLGTTNSCVAIIDGKTPRVRTTPSSVAFAKDGERLVGLAAKRQVVTRSFNDPLVKEVQKIVPYKMVKAGGSDDCWGNAQSKKYPPSQVGSMVLGMMKETAQGFPGRPVGKVGIAVLAYFNDNNGDTLLGGEEFDETLPKSKFENLVEAQGKEYSP